MMSYLVLMTLLTNGIQVRQHWCQMWVDCKGDYVEKYGHIPWEYLGQSMNSHISVFFIKSFKTSSPPAAYGPHVSLETHLCGSIPSFQNFLFTFWYWFHEGWNSLILSVKKIWSPSFLLATSSISLRTTYFCFVAEKDNNTDV